MEQQQNVGYQPFMANQTVPSYNNAYPQGMPNNNMPPNMSAPNNYYNVKQAGSLGSGLQRLESLHGIFVKKQLELAEVLLGCETQNRYHVYGLDETGKHKREPRLFKCKENSGFCSRQCLNANCRPFQMDVLTIQAGADRDVQEPFLSLSRPCKCTCLCIARPELSVNFVEGGQNVYLGKIKEPWTCCSMEQHVFDKENNHKYTITGGCDQLGFWCKCPCDPCQTINFEIKSASGEQIGAIQKRSQGCIKAAVSDTDIFTINFPSTSTSADKALLMSAVLFLDYNYFEKNPNKDNNNL